MNKNTGIIIGIIALVVIMGGVYGSLSNKDSMATKDDMVEEKVMMDKKAIEEGEADMTDKDMENANMVTKGSYEVYSPEKLVRAEDGDVVLFFHASWCPSCRGLNSNIEANVSSIPDGVNILKVDYDKETELKKKYGVTYQHTLVQVDANGNLIKKWSGSSSLANLVLQIQ